MKIPIFCPKCGDPLLNEPCTIYDLWIKSCTNKLSHNFNLIYRLDEHEARQIIIEIRPFIRMRFNLVEKTLTCLNGFSINDLPYFEPNIYEYDKLISKIKTYLVFQ